MKTIKVPFIDSIEKMAFRELDLALEEGGAKLAIDSANWEEYPYRPDTMVAVARSRTHLAIRYNVRGLDLRAKALDDNGNVWEDSCCEFFASDPSDGTYYNFELNCIGTLLASKRRSISEYTLMSKNELSEILRYSSLEREIYDISGEIMSWTAIICIPFRLFGVADSTIGCLEASETTSEMRKTLPKSIRANFFKCADKSAHPHFLSWNPIDTPNPDFHRPEFFGELLL